MNPKRSTSARELIFFLIAQSLTNCVSQIGTKVSIAPDHKALKVNLIIAKERRGPGLWKFINSLVEEEEYIKLIKAVKLPYHK